MLVCFDDDGEPGGLVVLWSNAADIAGRHFPFDPAAAPISIGRKTDNVIVLDADGISRHHAKIEYRADGWWVVDGGSMNGTMVNDTKVTASRLALGDRLQIGNSVIFKVVGKTWPTAAPDYRPDPATDGLTGLRNKRHLLWLLDGELQHAKRASRRVSLAMFDLDHFKRINDSFGHLAGDQVLRDIAALLSRLADPRDTVARYGGEELVWVMIDTDLEAAAKRAESARASIASRVIHFEQHAITTTVSAGVAQLDERLRTPEECIRRADEQLYKAKCAGRNCVRGR
jgi:diguanylate cyclase (GGDEF)-like protein